MADDDRAAAPGGEEIDHGLASVPVEIVGGLIQQQEVGLGEHQCGKTNPRRLAAGQAGQLRIGRKIEPDARQHGREPRFEGPVDRGDVVGGGIAPLRTSKQRQRFPHAEQIGHGGTRAQLNVLAQQADGPVGQNAPGLGNMFPADRGQQRGFPDAVAADETGSFSRECQIEIGKKRTAVRRGQRQVRQDDGSRHGIPREQGGSALRSG